MKNKRGVHKEGRNPATRKTMMLKKRRVVTFTFKCAGGSRDKMNKEMSEATGIDYDYIKLQPVILQDADGLDHKFHFPIR